MVRRTVSVIAVLAVFAACAFCQEVSTRIKDITTISGVHTVPLFGYGLVVGLAGTGDSKNAQFTVQSVANLLRNLGVAVPEKAVVVQNVAAVIVTATLSEFNVPGDRIDVTVSSIGDAKSLKGGILLLTPLQGPDGKIYAYAQGPVIVALQRDRRGREVGIKTIAKIPGGATVIEPLKERLRISSDFSLSLMYPDYTTAVNIAAAINSAFGADLATVVNAETVKVRIPAEYRAKVAEFISKVEQLETTPDVRAKVVIDEKTGTIVIGGNVKILPVAVSHGNLSVNVAGAAGAGEKRVLELPGATTVAELAQALNAIGVTPSDLIAILKAMREAGALLAEIEVR